MTLTLLRPLQLGVDHLTTLPNELIFKILIHCDIKHILQLRQVNKCLEFLSKDRSIWQERLISVCIEMGLDSHWFPVRESSSHTLEKLATGYLQMRNHAKQHVSTSPSESLEPFLCRTIQFPKLLSAVKFIFGGRYLIALTEFHMELWDIGLDCISPSKITEVDIIELFPLSDSVATYITSLQYVDQAATFNVVYLDHGSDLSSCLAYKIQPNLDVPVFESIGVHFSEVPVKYCGFLGDFITMLLLEPQEKIGVYDMVSHKTVWWTIEDQDDIYDIKFIPGDKLVATTVNNDCIYIFQVPVHVFRNQDAPIYVTVANHPICTLSWRDEIMAYPIERVHCGGLFTYDEFPQDTLSIDIFLLLQDKMLCIHKHISPPYHSPSSRTLSSSEWTAETTYTSEYPPLLLGYGEVPMSLPSPDGYHFIWFGDVTTKSVVKFYYSKVERERGDMEQNRPSFGGILYNIPDHKDTLPLSWRKYTFAPFFARLCVADGDHIRIYSYVP